MRQPPPSPMTIEVAVNAPSGEYVFHYDTNTLIVALDMEDSARKAFPQAFVRYSGKPADELSFRKEA